MATPFGTAADVRQAASGYALSASPRNERLTPLPGTSTIVESGRIKVSQISSAGREIILWFCFPGKVFGLAAVPGTGPRMVFAQAVTNARLHRINRTQFVSFLLENPHLSLELINLVLARLYLLCDVLLNVTTESADVRLRNLFFRLCHQYRKPVGTEVLLDLPLTQQDLAGMIGTSRQTVSELLAGMRAEGAIRSRGRSMYVRDPAALRL